MKRSSKALTHEFAVEPKYFALPEMLMDNDPNASTTSGLCSSSFTDWNADGVREPDGSLCRGAFMRNKSSVRRGWVSVESCACDDRKESSRSRTRFANSEIFSCNSWVDANTNL